jgi:hypothetical protein
MSKPYLVGQEIRPLKAIRSKCLDCSNHQPKEVELCPVTDCALFPFRFGRRPATQAKREARRQETA